MFANRSRQRINDIPLWRQLRAAARLAPWRCRTDATIGDDYERGTECHKPAAKPLATASTIL